MRPELLLGLGGYLAVLVGVGLRYSRRMRGPGDYFLASRSLSSGLVFLSLTASWFGATSILVTMDEAYGSGISAAWLVGVPAVTTVLLLAVFLAGPIRRLDAPTLPALVEARYGKAVRHAASILLLWYMIALASSQMVALGRFLEPFLGLRYAWCLGLGTAAVLVYLLGGGLFSVVATDVLQCVLLAAGMAGLAIHFSRFSSVAGVTTSARLDGKTGYFHFFQDGEKNALIALSFVLAWTISPIAWQRIQAAGSIQKARRGLLAAAGAFIILYSLVVFCGVFALESFSGRPLEHPLISEIITSRAGNLGGMLLFIVVAAAVLSTLDTALNTGAQTLTQDVIFEAFPRVKADARSGVRAGRLATLAVAIAAFGIAVRLPSILKTLGLASEILAEGLFVPGIAMFVLKKRTPMAGALSLVFGGGFALSSFLSTLNIFPLDLPDWPYSVPYGVALSLGGFLAGCLIDRKPA